MTEFKKIAVRNVEFGKNCKVIEPSNLMNVNWETMFL